MSSKIYLIMSLEEDYDSEPNPLFYVKDEDEAKKYVKLFTKVEKIARDFFESEERKSFVQEWMKEHPKPVPPIEPPKYGKFLNHPPGEEEWKVFRKHQSEEMKKYSQELAIFNDELFKWKDSYKKVMNNFDEKNCFSKIRNFLPEEYREKFVEYLSERMSMAIGSYYVAVNFYYVEVGG